MSRALGALSTFLLAASIGGIASAQVTFTTIPGAYTAMDVTPDGSIVVGTLDTGGAYYWRWQQDPAPTPIGGGSAVAVSDDGSVIAGNIDHPVSGQQVAARWTQATGWVDLHPGQLGVCGSISDAFDISGDGKSIVGLGWNACSGRGFLWTEAAGFTQELQSLGNGNNRASVISRDGSTVGGFAQGDFSRTPGAWNHADLTGTVFDMASVGEVLGLSDDGSTALGEWTNPAGTNIDAFYWPGWETDPTVQNLVYLGSLHAGWNGQAIDMAEPPAGSSVPPMIVGYDTQGLAADAWIWTPSGGIEQLQAKLSGLGVPGVPALGFCLSITPDARILVGHTFFGDAWIVHFPAPAVGTVYGCGVNPAGSMTVVSGSPEIGQTLTLGVDNPLGTQPPGSLPFVFLATAPSLLHPCGSALPGTGMGGGAGELLIDIIPPSLILPALAGPAWTGAGSPAPVQLSFPPNPNLIGKKLFGQGVLIDLTLTTVPVALTDAVDMTIGG